MKKVFLLLIAAIAFASCEKSTVSTSINDEVLNRRGADDVAVPPPANLPAAVLSSFTASYPTATRMEWQAEDGNTWKVKFFLGTQRWIAVYKADGTLVSVAKKN